MAHALAGYDGDCRNIHGHSYKLHVTLRGMPRQEPGHPKDGMVMDFGDLKKTVKEKVLDIFDHALALNELASSKAASDLVRHFEKIVLLPFHPTCENLALYIVERIRSSLPPHLEL
ncbi:MAG: 6-carboxytetrahydropterin synthase, partial [Bacteroidetes bacterium]|nr:6-carboxytetrahydropterin synthase [Bacteroidota bacterium]